MPRPRFRLQFRPVRIPRLAAAYTADQGPEAREAERVLVDDTGPAVRRDRCARKDQLVALAEWKSPRMRPRIGNNAPELVEEATRIALTVRHEYLRIGTLMVLEGVGFPMASVIMHFGHSDPYPVLDFRALEALGAKQPGSYTFAFWWDYVTACRGLAAKHSGGDMRMLDRALWQWSAEQ